MTLLVLLVMTTIQVRLCCRIDLAAFGIVLFFSVYRLFFCAYHANALLVLLSLLVPLVLLSLLVPPVLLSLLVPHVLLSHDHLSIRHFSYCFRAISTQGPTVEKGNYH